MPSAGANDENATRIRLHGRRILPSWAPSNHVGLEPLAPKHRNDHPEGHVEIAREQTDTVCQDCVAYFLKKPLELVPTGPDSIILGTPVIKVHICDRQLVRRTLYF